MSYATAKRRHYRQLQLRRYRAREVRDIYKRMKRYDIAQLAMQQLNEGIRA